MKVCALVYRQEKFISSDTFKHCQFLEQTKKVFLNTVLSIGGIIITNDNFSFLFRI
jgi:hypothetical protein